MERAPADFIVTAQVASVPPVFTTSSTIKMCCPCGWSPSRSVVVVIGDSYDMPKTVLKMLTHSMCVQIRWQEETAVTHRWIPVLYHNLTLVANPSLATEDRWYPWEHLAEPLLCAFVWECHSRYFRCALLHSITDLISSNVSQASENRPLKSCVRPAPL